MVVPLGALRMLGALLVLVLAGAGRCCALPSDKGHAVAVDAESCASVQEYFIRRNLSTPIPDQPQSGVELQVCPAGRSCCTPAMEATLQRHVHRDFSALVHHNSQSTQGLLVSSADGLRDHLVRLARWSESKTLSLFGQVYQRMAVLAREPIHQLYADIVRYLDTPHGLEGIDGANQGAAEPAWLSSPPQGPSMTDSVNRFFAKLFPLTFLTTVAPVKRGGDRPQRHLDPTYEKCLSSKMAEVQPFGDAPRALAHSLGRALEAARVLLGVLRIGAGVLNTTDSLLIDNDDLSGSPCPALLLRLWTCPRCAGLGEAVRPCQGYCLNVLRGCVTARASELDQPWSAFVEAAAKLAGSAAAAPAFPGRPRSAARDAPYQLNAEEAIRQMENKISEAIMFAMENGPGVERKMKSACGPTKWVDAVPAEAPSSSLSPPPTAAPAASAAQILAARRAEGHHLGPLYGGDLPGPLGSPASPASAVHFANTLRELQDSLLRSRSFYADLADVLCADEGFAAREAQPCWNGQSVAKYTKTVVASTASAQRYNPELTEPAAGSAPAPASLAHLVDQLRHLRHLVLSQLAELQQQVQSDSFVRDEDGYEPEGSGAGGASGAAGAAPTDDEDQAAWHGETGSGSGDGDGGVPGFDANNVEGNTNWSDPETKVTPGSGTEQDVQKDKTSGASPVHWSATSVSLCVSILTVLRLVLL
ncbi:division abnormally delayed protein [Frankliniella occidentalis]|uniref:Division abnormally delayed protein n=1 Tax=Frankliniella occidentalis TaxID=133901 RepID=A0A9C6U4K5_FRAOC|nr:division abnormally delayed protein [Frankliniella occidentalis]